MSAGGVHTASESTSQLKSKHKQCSTDWLLLSHRTSPESSDLSMGLGINSLAINCRWLANIWQNTNRQFSLQERVLLITWKLWKRQGFISKFISSSTSLGAGTVWTPQHKKAKPSSPLMSCCSSLDPFPTHLFSLCDISAHGKTASSQSFPSLLRAGAWYGSNKRKQKKKSQNHLPKW